MKFKIGDKVKVINCDSSGFACKNIGKIFTITKINDYWKHPYVLDEIGEIFRDDELELVQEKQFHKADLKDGDIVTYRNGDKRLVDATKEKIVFIENTSCLSFSFYEFRDDLTNKNGKKYDIVKVERPIKYETLFERKEEILDETEKRYLANIIGPFRGKIESIVKSSSLDTREYISIRLKKESSINFPFFREKTMYKGMEENKKYTLKDLGL